MLDGSRSRDADADPVQFSWFIDGAVTASATGRVAMVVGSSAMATARMYHTATLLLSGKVLVAGGWNSESSELLSAELYVP